MNFNFFKKKKMPMRMKLLKDAKHIEGFSILRDSKTINENHDFLLELPQDYDEFGFVDYETGKELDELFIDDDYTVGIHRTGYTIVTEDVISDVFNNGLINNGHAMQGAKNNHANIELTVSLFRELTIFLGQLKVSSKYKDSDGCFIIKIPKSYLGQKDGEIKPIYYQTGKTIRLLPEFIYGYVPVDREHNVGKIVNNPNYRDIHEYDNEGLIYDFSVSEPAKRI